MRVRSASWRACPLCSPLFPDHLELAVNDQFAPAAAFLGSALVNVNPPHVTYEYDTARDRPTLGLVANHAYWISGLALRSTSHTSATGDPEGEIDAVSHGFGLGDPSAPLLPTPGTGTLTGGNLGPLHYGSTTKTWGSAPASPRSDTIDLTATNISTASIDVHRADADCSVKLVINTDGPLTVTLPGCGRVVHAG